MKRSPKLLALVRRLAATAIIALLAIVGTVALMTALTWQSSQWVRHTRTVQFAGARALDHALDRQLSIGDYLITGDSADLARGQHARLALERQLDSLSQLTSDNSAQQQQLVRIGGALAAWDSTYVSTVLSASNAADRIRVGQAQHAGSVAFAALRADMDKFLEEEALLYQQRAQNNTIWRWALVAIVGLEALALLMVFIRLRRELVVQAVTAIDQQIQLEEQAIELEAQAAEQEMLTADLQMANQELTDAGMEQEALTADLELANAELTQAAAEAERARDDALRHEERYRLLFDRSPVPKWVYEEDTLSFLDVNEAAVQQYGYSRNEFLAMSLLDIQPPEERDALRGAAHRTNAVLQHAPGQRHTRKDGSLIHVDIATHGVELDGRRARIVLAIDVTARQEALAALNESNAILRAVIDDSPLAIVIVAPDLTINRWNSAAELQFGWSPRDAIGRPLFEILPEEQRQEFAELRERLEEGAVITNFETQRRHRDGNMRDLRVSTCALRGAGGVLSGFVSIFSDETDRKRLDAQFRQAQKMEAVGQLAGGVAHDFNNLLTVIISYSQMLLAEVSEGTTTRADVQEIKRAAERAALLTKQLLAFSRQQVLRPQVLDLNLVIGELEQMLRRLLREDISIVLNLEAELGSVAADPGQVEQIVVNLVVNARDAMPNGGRLSIETANVEFESPYQLRASDAPLEAGSYVMIAVSDNGSGIPMEIQTRVFEPFFTTKGAHEGTGLGLSTVYGIVKQSGGHLTMYSEPGHGSIFKIYLPRVDIAADAKTPEDASGVEATRTGETVLIVEDDDALRTVACRVLLQGGYTVFAASNGREGLRLCEEHDGALHLVLTDMVMPEMSGAELAENIAAHHPEIKVLLMSGYTRDEAARRGIANERYAFLEKPFTPHKLATKVRELLDGGRSRAVGMKTA